MALGNTTLLQAPVWPSTGHEIIEPTVTWYWYALRQYHPRGFNGYV
jgi:hypothetical protein